jgi:hypothetical protein
MGRRARGPYRAISQVDRVARRTEATTGALAAELTEIKTALADLSERLDTLTGGLLEPVAGAVHRIDVLLAHEMRVVLRVLAAQEPENRRRLFEAREHPEYELAWKEERPLVSVILPTAGRPELLRTRALPSVLAQTYDHIEVILVSDGAGSETQQVAHEFANDPRVRFVDLGARFAWELDPSRHWLAAATRPINAGLRMSRGRWIVHFDDDDELGAESIAKLLELARAERAELVYGRVRTHDGNGGSRIIGEFPPRIGGFSGGGSMYHGGLRFLERDYVAGALGIPGDWWMAERLLRAGARFAMHPDVLADVYPSASRGDRFSPPAPG